MKTDRVIDENEKELETLRKCRYCGSEAMVYIRVDRNYKGEKSFIATVKCKGCYASVFAFGKDERSADVMARSYWNRGILDRE